MNAVVTKALESARKNSNNEIVNGFTGNVSMRTMGIPQLKKDDVIEFPKAAGFEVVKSQIRGAEADPETGEVPTSQQVIMDVTRGEAHKAIGIYPNILYKSLRETDENGYYTGDWCNAEGEVVDFAQDYDDINKAFVAIGQKGKVKVVDIKTCYALPFGKEEGDKPRKSSVYVLGWA